MRDLIWGTLLGVQIANLYICVQNIKDLKEIIKELKKLKGEQNEN